MLRDVCYGPLGRRDFALLVVCSHYPCRSIKPDPPQINVADIQEQGHNCEVWPQRRWQGRGFFVRLEYVLRCRLEPPFCLIANGAQEICVWRVKVKFVGIRIRECPRWSSAFANDAKGMRAFLRESEPRFVGSRSDLLQ